MSNETSYMSLTAQCFSKELAYYSLLIVISVFIICINLDVIFTMATNKTLQTKRNAFLASLSVSDLLTGLVSIPLHISSSCHDPLLPTVVLAQAICYRFVVISTMLNIFMITVERYIGIIYPIKYQFILTKARTSVLITCTWATSISSALVSCSWLVSGDAGNKGIPPQVQLFEKVYFIFCFVAFFLLPLVVMIVLYTKMFRVISKARKLASKSRTNLKNQVRTQSLCARSPVVEVCVTRPRSVSQGSYSGRHSRSRRWSQTPSPGSTPETRLRSRSHGSYGDHLTVNGNGISRSQSPVRFTQVETMVTYTGSPTGVTVSRPQSPDLVLANCDVSKCSPVSGHISSPVSGRHSQQQPGSPYLSLPLEKRNRQTNHQDSNDHGPATNQGLKSSSEFSSSIQALNCVTCSKSGQNSLGEYENSYRERSSFAERLSDVCESAASKLRMLRQGSYEERWGQARITREHRVLLVFVTMLSVFVFSWISWYVLVLDFTYSIDIPAVVHDCFDILRYSVSFLNPILYTFFKNDFRNAFKKSLRGCMRSQKKRKADLKELKEKFRKQTPQ